MKNEKDVCKENRRLTDEEISKVAGGVSCGKVEIQCECGGTVGSFVMKNTVRCDKCRKLLGKI